MKFPQNMLNNLARMNFEMHDARNTTNNSLKTNGDMYTAWCPPMGTPIALTFVTYNALQRCLYAKHPRGVIADQSCPLKCIPL